MCVCPLPIHHFTSDCRKVLDFVPCGRCHECISKKQNEFAALACLEAKRRKSMFHFTFTYGNASCPIMAYFKNEFDEVSTWFVSSSERLKVVELLALNLDGSKKLNSREDMGITYTPSLRREDVRLFIKRTRLAYRRAFGSISDFVYAGFGEYGDSTYRPHYHFLFLDLTDHEAAYFQDAWRSQFGFCSCDKIPVLNSDGSPAHVKVSKYVAKYLGKCKDDYLPLFEGMVEAPRRISSKNFGVGVVDDKLKDFYLCKDLSHLNKEARLSEILSRKRSLIIDGAKFPLPRRISDKFFRELLGVYEYDYVNEKTGEITKRTFRKDVRTALSFEVSDFARDRYLQAFTDKLRVYTDAHPDEDVSRYICEVLSDEKASLEDRAQRARKLYLQRLKNQKYG